MHKPLYFIVLAVGVTSLAAASGCTWKRPYSASAFDQWNLTPAQRDSLTVIFNDRQEMKNEISRLKKQVNSQQLDLTKMAAELEYRTERNKFLESAMADAQRDLALVEKQFISIEQQLQTNDTKASAVAVLAEVKLRYDNIRKNSSITADSLTIREIERKIKESEDLLDRKNFAAAAYYAKRADRLIRLAQEDNARLYPDGEARIVSVPRANVRRGPGTTFDVITNLEFGTVLIQIDETNDWSHIRTKNGQEGWILTALLR